MNAVVFEHLPVAELPEKWRALLAQGSNALLTVRIEEEAQSVPAEEFVTDDPAFGIWRDREEMADVAAYVRKIRQQRFNRDGSRYLEQGPPILRSATLLPMSEAIGDQAATSSHCLQMGDPLIVASALDHGLPVLSANDKQLGAATGLRVVAFAL